MNIFLFILGLSMILFVCNRIYIFKNKKNKRENLKEIQLSLWGYIGEPDNKKRKELYEKYLEVYGSQMDSRI